MNISDNPIVESVAWLGSVEPVCVVPALSGHDTLICWNAISLAWTLVTQFTSDIANTMDHCVSHISSICQYIRPQVELQDNASIIEIKNLLALTCSTQDPRNLFSIRLECCLFVTATFTTCYAFQSWKSMQNEPKLKCFSVNVQIWSQFRATVHCPSVNNWSCRVALYSLP